ncbi:hypothetical protein LPJ73_000849 [Coemansia sp. RSA 2703]|nr:hypothetical protein LPJ73_000849 [Coemansia sp. RSA 2703]
MSYYNNNDNNEVGGFHVPQGSGYAQDDETTDRAYNNAGPYGGNPYGNPTSPPGGFSGPGPNYNNNPYGNNNNQYGNNNNGGYGNNNGGYGAPSGPPSGYQAGPRPQQGGGSNNNNGPYGGNTGGGGYGQQQQHQQQQRPPQGNSGPSFSNYEPGQSQYRPQGQQQHQQQRPPQNQGQGQGQQFRPQQQQQQRPPQQQQQRPPQQQQRPPQQQQGGGLPGGLDLGALGPLAASFFGGGGKSGAGGGGGAGGAAGLGALAALAPMALGLLSGAGGKSGSGGGGGAAGGLGPLLGIATSFLGGGGPGAGPSGGSSGGPGGSNFFSKILGNVFGNRTRDLDNGSLSGLGSTDAQRYHSEIYQNHASLSRFNDEQLGAAAAVEAISRMQRSGEIDRWAGDEQASQKMLGAVMGEAVSLHERHREQGGDADKEETATAAVRTALKVIDEAADGNNSGYNTNSSYSGGYQHQNQNYDGYNSGYSGNSAYNNNSVYGGENQNYDRY